VHPNAIQRRGIPAAASRGKTVVSKPVAGSDLVQGVKQVCSQHRIRQATITTAIGKLVHAQRVYVVPDPQSAIGITPVEPTRIEGPLELVSGRGVLGEKRHKENQVFTCTLF